MQELADGSEDDAEERGVSIAQPAAAYDQPGRGNADGLRSASQSVSARAPFVPRKRALKLIADELKVRSACQPTG